MLHRPSSATLGPMVTFQARVENGRIVVDCGTDLPEGTQLTLVVVEDDEMGDEERAALEEEISRGHAEIVAGRGIPGDELLARVRES